MQTFREFFAARGGLQRYLTFDSQLEVVMEAVEPYIDEELVPTLLQRIGERPIQRHTVETKPLVLHVKPGQSVLVKHGEVK